MLDLAAGRYEGNPVAQHGYYRVAPPIENIEPFDIPLTTRKRFRRRRIRGRYEMPVLEHLSKNVDASTTFWEVGARRGYFSLALAPIVDDVVAFEGQEVEAEQLVAARDRNDFQNIRIVDDYVQSLDDYLDEFDRPDVCLIDIEGWEYDVLSRSTELLSTGVTLLVELHGPESGFASGQHINTFGEVESVPKPERVDPGGVEELLRDNGYIVETLYRRRESNWHVLATPGGN